MPRPSLAFFNEQDAVDLATTFTPEVLQQLATLEAGVAMGMRDLTDARAVTIRSLEAAGVPVTAWVLLSQAFSLPGSPQRGVVLWPPLMWGPWLST